MKHKADFLGFSVRVHVNLHKKNLGKYRKPPLRMYNF